MAVLECIPNVSEGRRPEVVEAAAAAVRAVEGVSLLDYSADPDHNRSVFTFLGEARAVVEGALALAEAALPHVDMRRHQGGHPRVGAVDVVPFVPLADARMDDAVAAARSFGEEFNRRAGIPIFYYGAAATAPHRRRHADLRRGEYEGLAAKMKEPRWRPDLGDPAPHERWGAALVGARGPLIAFNVNLETDDVAVARRIARCVRESSGGLPAVQARGMMLASQNRAQVSLNLTDYRATGVHAAYEAVREEAERLGTAVHSSELIGLMPLEALCLSTAHALKLPGFTPGRVIEGSWLDRLRGVETAPATREDAS